MMIVWMIWKQILVFYAFQITFLALSFQCVHNSTYNPYDIATTYHRGSLHLQEELGETADNRRHHGAAIHLLLAQTIVELPQGPQTAQVQLQLTNPGAPVMQTSQTFKGCNKSYKEGRMELSLLGTTCIQS